MKKAVSLDSKVTVKCNNIARTLRLVKSQDLDSEVSKISETSPLGKLLLGSKANDIIKVKTPNGVMKYKVVSIKR